jgi:WhiB family transcriptional regulator, redox-sensing transcriptional regulator
MHNSSTGQPGLSATTLTLTRPARWMAGALCAQADPEAWFPEKGESTRLAKVICRRCPVKAPCLEYALARNERFGVWGGLSERERRELARDRRAAA